MNVSAILEKEKNYSVNYSLKTQNMEIALKSYKSRVLKEYATMLIISVIITIIIVVIYLSSINEMNQITKDFITLLFTIPFILFFTSTFVMLYKLRPNAKKRICDTFIIVEKCVKERISDDEIEDAIECRNYGCSVLTSEIMDKIQADIPYKVENLWEYLNIILDKYEKARNEEAIQT